MLEGQALVSLDHGAIVPGRNPSTQIASVGRLVGFWHSHPATRDASNPSAAYACSLRFPRGTPSETDLTSLLGVLRWHEEHGRQFSVELQPATRALRVPGLGGVEDLDLLLPRPGWSGSFEGILSVRRRGGTRVPSVPVVTT